jgi:hypothetical protein
MQSFSEWLLKNHANTISEYGGVFRVIPPEVEEKVIDLYTDPNTVAQSLKLGLGVFGYISMMTGLSKHVIKHNILARQGVEPKEPISRTDIKRSQHIMPGYKDKVSMSQTLAMAKPDVKQRHQSAIRAANLRPEVRQNRSAASKLAYDNATEERKAVIRRMMGLKGQI